MRPVALVVGGVAVCLLARTTVPAPSAQSAAPRVDFVREIQRFCGSTVSGCQGPTQPMNGLRFDRRRDAMRGGTAPLIGPGHGEASQLYLRGAGS